MRLPKVCLALSGDTIEDMLATAESMARDNPFLEFRLDYLKQPLSGLPKIHRFLETHQYITAVGTCRRAENGGKFKGSLVCQFEVLTKAHAAGCQIVDLELQSALKAKPEAIRGKFIKSLTLSSTMSPPVHIDPKEYGSF